jgi:hypothetical protein
VKLVYLLLVGIIGSSVQGRNLVEKLLGQDSQRGVDYEERNGVALRGTIIKLSDQQPYNRIEIVQIAPKSRTIYVADPETGKVLFYLPSFDNCNPQSTVVRYALYFKVDGQREDKGQMSWRCGVNLTTVTKPVGLNSDFGRHIQRQFDRLVNLFELPDPTTSSVAASGPAPAEKSKDERQWVTVAHGLIRLWRLMFSDVFIRSFIDFK